VKRVFMFLIICGSLMAPLISTTQNQVAASKAARYVGESARVFGNIASTKYAKSTRGSPTFLNLDNLILSRFYCADLG
jgi:hypothetical protein